MYYGGNLEWEIKMDVIKFVEEKTEEIKSTVGSEKAISALSGGVDSSACTVDAADEFFSALKGLTDPEEVRKAFRNKFYSVFGR